MSNITQYINRLSNREKVIIVMGLIGAIAILVYGSVVAPLVERYTNLNRVIKQKESQYYEILKLREEYLALNKEYTELEKAASRAKEGFSPLTFMEGVSVQAKIKDKVVSMKPMLTPMGENYRESSIEVKIEKVVLEQTMRYLHLIESSEYPLKVKTLHLKSRFDDPGLMDVSVVVSFYEKIK
jgi:general secretion pathway protein M